MTSVVQLFVLSLAACFPKPLDLHVTDADTGAPVPGVALHKHAISLLTLLPTRQNPIVSEPDGNARVWVPPLNTNITLLRPGYEPASVAVFKNDIPSSMEGTADRPRLQFGDLREGDVVNIKMKPVRRTTTGVRVVDADDGQPIVDSEVLASTFLYLPAPGLEDGWGFPDLQSTWTNPDGAARVDLISGFRNRITIRAAGRAAIQQDLPVNGSDSLVMRSQSLRWKPIRFEVLDEKYGTPVEGAWVILEQPRHGLPPDPNAFAAVTGADGLTPHIPIPDLVPLVIQIRAPGHRDRRESIEWNSIGERDTRTIWIYRKGWFESVTTLRETTVR